MRSLGKKKNILGSEQCKRFIGCINHSICSAAEGPLFVTICDSIVSGNLLAASELPLPQGAQGCDQATPDLGAWRRTRRLLEVQKGSRTVSLPSLVKVTQHL